MNTYSILRDIAHKVDVVADVPIIGTLYNRVYDRVFAAVSGNLRLFRGVYPDFASAADSAPHTKPLGYDNEASALLLADDRHHVWASDYPVMFWLNKLIGDHSIIFDCGGNVGISFFAYQSYLSYPPDARWVVYEVPAVAAAGRAIAASSGAKQLSFVTDYKDVPNADIFLAAGVLQYLEDPFRPFREATRLPPHIIINKTPIFDRPSAVTLQGTGAAFCPYHLFNRTEFLQQFHDLGYVVVNEWENPNVGCRIRGYSYYNIPSFSGFYLKRSSN
ncbi:methyltransferase, TIGR04325 family [Methylocella silvestris]|uniref:Methyltransferase, TIGR04325 family n=1 Tax=Methylocella silvestris TaxID=199596 RepID=A0A2J7TI34_METSI|nr:methyltransferase, TIGR04325 family [Methylocella silvestris]PNG26422.1 methyltransferase, TIGR04325 family [Methylocella silvestris]